MFKSFSFHIDRIKKFGIRAFAFYLKQRIKKRKLSEIKIRKIRHTFSISNWGPDLTTLFQIFFAKEYEMPFDISPHYIIDLGANIGLSAIYYANKFPYAKIIALEPDEENFKLLKLNTLPYNNIISLHKAIWIESKKINLISNESGNWGHQTTDANIEGLKTIESISLVDLVYEYNIDRIGILKIDIEGAEKKIFSYNFHEWLSRVDTLAIELHPDIDEAIPEIFENAISPFPHRRYFSGENLICDFREQY